jgi:Arc/MetJ-type ribon-helix-helix transcriptional regulator
MPGLDSRAPNKAVLTGRLKEYINYISTEAKMARFMISMPDEMLKKLDEAARKEHRSRSELLREAARHRLTADAAASPASSSSRTRTQKIPRTRATGVARERLLRLGIGLSGCPGLDRLVGPDKVRPDMRRLMKIGKKLSGLSRDIIESRKDRW